MSKATRIFNQVFEKYDDLNASVQENVTAIRVVKAFVREDYENKKFSKASQMLYKMFVKAEGLLAFNNPAMMIAVYFCIISVSWFGAQFIVGGTLTTGDLTSLFSYIMALLMSLIIYAGAGQYMGVLGYIVYLIWVFCAVEKNCFVYNTILGMYYKGMGCCA